VADLTVLVVPDSQNGFRGSRPLHDRLGWEAAVALVPHANRIVLLGDMVDLPALSKYAHGNDLRGSTKKAIEETRWWLKRLRDAGENKPIDYIFGNHEERLAATFKKHCPDLEDVFTLEDALGLAELNIRPVRPYGADLEIRGVIYTHGDKYAKHGGQTAAKYLADCDQSVVYGHCHKFELAHKTSRGRTRFAGSPGTISMRNGAVPGSSAHPDWQSGFFLVHYQRGHSPWVEPIRFDGKHMYVANMPLEVKHDHKARQKDLGF